MSKKRAIPSAGLSMMDLISNALAGIIILFFILSSSKFPSIPPERVCGTLVVEFEMRKSDPDDFSKVWVQYNYAPEPYFKNYKDPSFDAAISKLNDDIQDHSRSHCTSDSTSKIDTNQTPAINTYQIFDTSKTKHVIIVHDPPQGEWTFGLLYTDHIKILTELQDDSVAVSYVWYSEKEPFQLRPKTMRLIAPTSRAWVHLVFDDKKIVRDKIYPPDQSKPN